MRIIALSTLKSYWERNPSTQNLKQSALAWYRMTLKADWASPIDVKRQFSNASILKDGRVVFNLAGNCYRLAVRVNYPYRIVYIRFIGSHAEYDEIDAQKI